MPWQDSPAAVATMVSHIGTYKNGGFGSNDPIEREAGRLCNWLSAQMLSQIEKENKPKEEYEICVKIIFKDTAKVRVCGQDFRSEFRKKDFLKVVENAMKIFSMRVEYTFEVVNNSKGNVLLMLRLKPKD